jgi:Uma2 family endonuclease
MRFTVRDVTRILETGVFADKPRFELLDGELFTMPPMKPPHLWRVKHLYDRLKVQFEGQAQVMSQSTMQLPRDGLPQPDITLFRLETPQDRWVLPEDVHLLIEVSDSTLADDRNCKLKLYARDGIREYWIVNLTDDQLEVHRDPNGERYDTMFTVKAAAQTCLDFPETAIDWT